jgi:putative mycofactocin binding protein MftB
MTTTPGSAGRPTPTPFTLDAPWRLHPQVSVRLERFGVLLCHLGTRRLSFLRNTTIADLVRSLADYPTARAACIAAGRPRQRTPVIRAGAGDTHEVAHDR